MATIRQRDKFTRKAISEGYSARSVYKLKDIQNRFKIIKKGNKILDLGAAPGAWSQFVIELGANVDAVDLNKVSHGNYIRGDVMDNKLIESLNENYNVVLSDLAPKTIGVQKIDNEISYDLSMRALEIAKLKLKLGGHFVCKIFQSEYSKGFIEETRKCFKYIKIVKPEASKKRSKEIYIVGLNKK